MRKHAALGAMPPPPMLDDLLNDGRLARLFSKDSSDCALQMWIVQIKSGESVENRLAYGRLVPYSYSSDRWSASEDDNFRPYGRVEAQLVRLNLYLKSVHTVTLLRGLSAGKTVTDISEELKLGLSDELKARFGSTALAADELVYRPVAYQLNRDAYDRRSPSSPHGFCGAFSASITRIDKGELFRLGPEYDVALTAMMVKRLNADTGMDFGGADAARFGDLELLVFPALDDHERRLLSVSWANTSGALVARFNPLQMPHFKGFQFRLSIANDAQIVYSGVAAAQRDAEGVFECRFELSDQLRARTDSTELEIFGFHGEDVREGTLCCRWRIGYVRELHLQGHVTGGGSTPVKFDWLEKTIRPSMETRVKAALTINRGNLGFTNRIGGREADPWVQPNRDLVALFARLHPPKSQGRFFLRWGQGDPEGRLQFFEWFKDLLKKYVQHQVVIFDPYFEDAGLGLLLLCAPDKADYLVFTSLPKPKEGEPTAGEPDKRENTRIANLVAGCELNYHLMQGMKLCIHGLKDGRLHDRYILITEADGLPVAGFNLSNSFQKAAENYPLLVTPIPADVLLQVEQYKAELVKEARRAQDALEAQSDSQAENPAMRLLFDSTDVPVPPRYFEPLQFLEKAQAGYVLSAWTGEPSLEGLSGALLKERLAALELLNEDDRLRLPATPGLRGCLDRQAGNFSDFTADWEVLGGVLANTHHTDRRYPGLESEPTFLEFLRRFLESSFQRAPDAADKVSAFSDPRHFREPVETLLYSSYHPHHWFHATKYGALTWPEYFAIEFLWRYAPEALLAITEAQSVAVPQNPQIRDAVRLSLLSQIAAHVSLSVQFGASEAQRARLVGSSNGLLHWMGLNAIEQLLQKPEGLPTVLEQVAAFSYPERVRALGWMVQRAAKIPKKVAIYQNLVTALHETLPAAIPPADLRRLVDSLRGHMQQLAWSEPWLFMNVVLPLLENKRAKHDDACEIWVQELAHMLEPQQKHQPRLFENEREGQTSNVTAYLVAYSTPEQRQASLEVLQAILKRQQRIIQQPLASTAEWSRWDCALTVSLWILAFCRWVEIYLRQRGLVDRDLERLSRKARELALVRPMVEWREEGAGKLGQLAAFFMQAEDLLIVPVEPEKNSSGRTGEG